MHPCLSALGVHFAVQSLLEQILDRFAGFATPGRQSLVLSHSCCNAIATAILVISSATVEVQAKNSINFPGKIAELKSPDASCSVKSVPLPANVVTKQAGIKQAGNQLLLKKNGQNFPLCIYQRNVDVLWAPDSSKFAVNDWLGSNISQPYLYYTKNPANQLQVIPQLRDQKDRDSISHCGHVYTFVSKWISADKAEVKIMGQDGPTTEFTIWFEWDLKNDQFKRVKRIESMDPARDVPD